MTTQTWLDIVNVATWILQFLLAVMFVFIGGMKVVAPAATLRSMHLRPGWARVLGVAEVLGALGLILPGVTGVAPWLTPVAALCLAFVLGAALVFHRTHPSPRGTGLLWAGLAMAVAVAAIRIFVLPL